MAKVTVTFQPYGRRMVIFEEVSLLEASRIAGINIRSICGGKGDCGKCKVAVKRGEVDFRYNPEEKLLTNEELSEGHILACLAYPKSDCEIFIPPETRIEGQRIQTDAMLPKIKPEPLVRKVLGGDSNGVTLTVKKIANRTKTLAIEEGDTRDRLFGLAIDIGTTKVVAYLVNLVTGDVLGSESDYNKQLMYGEDVVSRISYTMDVKDGLPMLQKTVIDTINDLIVRLKVRCNVDEHEIYDICVAGNTVMTYLFARMNPSPLLEPKAEVDREPVILSAGTLNLKVNPLAEVFCLPCASRFLGGDAIGDILLSGMHESPDISLLIDIGTNVEVVLGSEGWYLSTTAAAGPAFEGWGIKFGLRAIEGAIEKVEIDPKTLKAKCTVIGAIKPKGICGSGLIDLFAEMFRKGIIDSLGKINRNIKSPYIREGEDGYEYVVAPAEDTSIGRDIVFTERDIVNLIDSKSSACAAIGVILKRMRLSVSDVTKVYICGAFGSYLDPNSAMAIGLIPEFLNAKIVYLGNGSVGGAYLTLISEEYRRKAKEIADLMSYFELLKDADFMDEYTAGYALPGKQELFPLWWKACRKIKYT